MPDTPPAAPRVLRRRRSSAGYARGDETRTRIIQAAVQLFGTQGYERTSTRDIAARAGVNSPALQYYFDGKEGLYLACAEYMHERSAQRLQPIIDAVRQRLATRPDTEGLIECVCLVFEQIADYLLTSSEIDAWIRFMAWDDLERERVPPVVTHFIENGIRRDFRALLYEIVGRIIGLPADDTQTRLRAIMLGSQLAIFHLERRKVLHDLGWSRIDERGLQLIKHIVREQTHVTLRYAHQHRRRTAAAPTAKRRKAKRGS